ncbi:T9SS type A sorting domain-containing protein [Winogradskyella costae]|uniref:T9SS type A sorting domain-containing protein n=1 Tax=Winogradskyella costae TaxID=2697008 RepID=UPI0015CAF5E1|nr:T9SS type A sorting domain-containing protein [Winogradskyella costae]
MKKITFSILFFGLSLLGFSQVIQNFGTTGVDNDAVVLTINSADITVNGADPITAISLATFTVHFNSATGGTTYCGDWYDFDLAVIGGASDGTTIPAGCDADFNGLDVTGFSTITLTSNDLDGYFDVIFFDIDLLVSFDASSPPSCDAMLSATENVFLEGDISWSEASGIVDGYDVAVGTASGLSDVYSETLGNVTTTNIGALLEGTTYYVTITPFNSVGASIDCAEQTFVTFVFPVNDDIAAAIAITVDEGFCDGTNTNANNIQTSGSAEAFGSCFQGTEALSDVWFTFTVPADVASVDVSTDFTGGTLTDTELAVYSGIPGNLVEIGCSQDEGTTVLSNGNTYNSLITDLAVTVGETYYVQVDGYTTQTGTFCLDISTNQVLSTVNYESESAFTYYPNPVKNTLTLNAQNTIEQVAMYNMLGQEVLGATPNAVDSDLDMSNLATGAYFIKVTIANVTETIRVIKQ